MCQHLLGNLPENMLATAAITKLNITPGPAVLWATMPATRYMPVPQQEPTPNDVKSRVVRHFYGILQNRIKRSFSSHFFFGMNFPMIFYS